MNPFFLGLVFGFAKEVLQSAPSYYEKYLNSVEEAAKKYYTKASYVPTQRNKDEDFHKFLTGEGISVERADYFASLNIWDAEKQLPSDILALYKKYKI
jgi:hypothetical protein